MIVFLRSDVIQAMLFSLCAIVRDTEVSAHFFLTFAALTLKY